MRRGSVLAVCGLAALLLVAVTAAILVAGRSGDAAALADVRPTPSPTAAAPGSAAAKRVEPVGVSRAIKVPDPREPATACFLFTRAAGASVFVRTRLPGCEMALAL